MTEVGRGHIVRADRIRAADEAGAIVRDAEQARERILASAHREAERIRSAATDDAALLRVEARERGRDDAATDAAALMAEVSSTLDRFWRDREAELRDVALGVAHRILTSIPDDELTVRLATDALAEHGRDTRLALKVGTDMAERLRAALVAQGVGDRVTVAADPSLGPGDCTLLHPSGRADVGLVAQFRSLMGSAGAAAP